MYVYGDRPVAVTQSVADEDIEDLPYGGRGGEAAGQIRLGDTDQAPAVGGEGRVPAGADILQQAAGLERRGGQAGAPDQGKEILDGGSEMVAAREGVAQCGAQVGARADER